VSDVRTIFAAAPGFSAHTTRPGNWEDMSEVSPTAMIRLLASVGLSAMRTRSDRVTDCAWTPGAAKVPQATLSVRRIGAKARVFGEARSIVMTFR